VGVGVSEEVERVRRVHMNDIGRYGRIIQVESPVSAILHLR
jgi:hypothetical protein